MSGIMKRRHRSKMRKQRAKQIKRGRVHKSNAHKRRARRLGVWSPNPKGK